MELKSKITIFFFVITQSFYAQVDSRTLTEAQVNLEEMFANAQKEALVGKPEKAIELFETVFKEDRTNAAVAIELAKLHHAKGDFVLEEKFAKIAADNATQNMHVTEYYADLLLAGNRPENALPYFLRLKTLSPTNLKYYQNLVDCYLLLGKKNDAILVYDEMEVRIGNMEEVYLSRFEIYDSQNNDAAALAQIDHLIKLYPNNIKYLKTKARFYTRKQKIDEAVSLYKEVLKIAPEDTDANLAILSKGEDAEKPNAYLMALLPVVSNPSINIDAKVKELLPYLDNLSKGNNPELLHSMKDLADKLVLAHPDEAKAHSLYGDVLYMSGDVDHAIVQYEKTLVLNQKVFSVWEQLMYAYLDNADYETLYKKSLKALDVFPNQAMSYFFNSIANTMKGNADEALLTADEGKIVCGGNTVQLSQIYTALAQAYLWKNDLVKSDEALMEALRLSHQNNGYALEIQADHFRASGNSVKALEMYTMIYNKGNHTKRLSQKLQSLKGN